MSTDKKWREAFLHKASDVYYTAEQFAEELKREPRMAKVYLRFIEHQAYLDLQATNALLHVDLQETKTKLALTKAELKILKNPSDGRCMEIAALREENARLNRECISLFLHDCRMKEVEAKLAIAVEALEFECGNRCAPQNPCNARETLEKIK